MGGGGLRGLFSDGSATSAPFTAQASGGPVTIPQGSTIADMSPGLTGFEQQSGGGMPEQNQWGSAMKSLVQGLPKLMQAGQGQSMPAQLPGMTMPQPGKYAPGAAQGATSPLTGTPLISLPLIHSALAALKGRMGGF
jgi:hypothetical protein